MLDRPSSSGFTLIEVVVTLFVLALGLVGFLQMNVYIAQKARTTYYTSTAGLILSEFNESIYANRRGLLDGHYDVLDTQFFNTASEDCSDQICTPEELSDYNEWLMLQKVKTQLPWDSDQNLPRVEVSGSGAAGALTVTIRWFDIGAPQNSVAELEQELRFITSGVVK